MIMIDALAAKGRGLELCTQARRSLPLARTALILLAVDASEEERIQGLELGADDYITGLQSAPELVARVQAVIRRFARALRGTAYLPSGPFLFSCQRQGRLRPET